MLPAVERPHGGAARGGKSAHTAGSKEAARALAATYRASAAPGVVPVGSGIYVAPPTYAGNLLRLPVHRRHNLRNVLTCDIL